MGKRAIGYTTCQHCGARIQGGMRFNPPTMPRLSLPFGRGGERTENAVMVPLQQAAITGAIATGVVSLAFSYVPILRDWWARAGALSGLTTTGLVWLWAVGVDFGRVRDRLETALDLDLDGNDVIGGQPAPQVEETLLPIYAPQRKPPEKKRTRERFQRFLEGCEHQSTAQNYWEKQRRMDREIYEEWRDTVIGLGWAAWRRKSGDRGGGWYLLFTAREIMTGMFSSGGIKAPSPTGDNGA